MKRAHRHWLAIAIAFLSTFAGGPMAWAMAFPGDPVEEPASAHCMDHDGAASGESVPAPATDDCCDSGQCHCAPSVLVTIPPIASVAHVGITPPRHTFRSAPASAPDRLLRPPI